MLLIFLLIYCRSHRHSDKAFKKESYYYHEIWIHFLWGLNYIYEVVVLHVILTTSLEFFKSGFQTLAYKFFYRGINYSHFQTCWEFSRHILLIPKCFLQLLQICINYCIALKNMSACFPLSWDLSGVWDFESWYEINIYK